MSARDVDDIGFEEAECDKCVPPVKESDIGQIQHELSKILMDDSVISSSVDISQTR